MLKNSWKIGEILPSYYWLVFLKIFIPTLIVLEFNNKGWGTMVLGLRVVIWLLVYDMFASPHA